MPEVILKSAFQYAGYGLEVTLLVTLLRRGYIHGLMALVVYVGTLFGADAVVRPRTLLKYGSQSREYFNAYWITELILVFATFVLICALFRRACNLHASGTWSFVWPVLASSLVMVLAVSAAEFRHHFNQLFTSDYIWEFNQNLGFTCLALNTALYMLLQWVRKKDGQLQLLVCGLGIQLAGPTASYALVHVTSNSSVTVQLLTYFSPLCGLAMLGIWLYAVAHERRATRRGALAHDNGLPVAV